MKLPLSVVIITLNEDKNIERCLKSVSFAEQVLVVDSFSTDHTVEKARSLGADVLQKEWLGFGAQKHFAAAQAKFDWILSIDADEALSDELQYELKNKFSQLEAKAAYAVPRKSFHFAKWIRAGGWYPDYQVKLFNRKHSQWNQDSIHENIVAEKVLHLENPLLHWVFRDLSHQVQTNDRYSTLQAEKLFQQGQKFSLFKLLTKPVSKFLETYIWKCGFRDGMAGLIISVSAGYSVFLKWSKIWELQKIKSKGNTK